MCDVCFLRALLMVVLQPPAFFPLPLLTYHKPQTQLMEKLSLQWTLIFPFLGETVQLFVSDSPHPPFISSAHPSEQCCVIFLRTGFDRRHCLWAGLTASPSLTGMWLALLQGSCWQWTGSWDSFCLLITPCDRVTDLSGHSCSSQIRVCLFSSSPFLPVVTCVSLLPFSKVTQPTYLLLLPTLRTHLTATGTATPNMKILYLSQDSLPTISTLPTPSSLWQQLYPIPQGWHQDLEFPVATEDATWSL